MHKSKDSKGKETLFKRLGTLAIQLLAVDVDVNETAVTGYHWLVNDRISTSRFEILTFAAIIPNVNVSESFQNIHHN